MSARELEAFLARIYVDPSARVRFQAAPQSEARRAGLSQEECAFLKNMDWEGLELAARSYEHKRRLKAKWSDRRSIFLSLRSFFRSLSRSVRSLL